MSEHPSWAPRGVALLRLALIPIILLIESTIAFPRRGPDDGFRTILAVAGVYAVSALVLAYRAEGRPPGGWRPYTLLDAGFLGLLAWRSGGSTSEVRSLLAAMPFAVALVGRPRATAATALLVLAVYLVAAEAQPGSPERGYLGGESLLFAWRAALAVLLSQAVTSARDLRAQRDAERQLLLSRVETASEQARRDLAYALHDDVLQYLYTARMKLGSRDPSAADTAGRAVDGAATRIRELIQDLRPADVARVGAAEGLREVASQLYEIREDVHIDVDFPLEARSPHDELVFALGRELLTNAVKHSHASQVALTVSREGEELILEVDDDGRGIAPDRRRQAAAQGHIGLLTCQERVAVIGGQLAIRTSAERGTTVTVRLPWSAAGPAHPA